MSAIVKLLPIYQDNQMKNVLLACFIALLCNVANSFSQTQFEIQDVNTVGGEPIMAMGLGSQSEVEKLEEKGNFLSNILTSVGMFNDGSSGISLESGTSIINYFIILNERKKILNADSSKATNLYSGVNFSIMSRGKVVFDTLNNVLTDYLGSLQASPLTLRLKYQYRLNEKNYLLDTLLPQLSARVSLDGRISPFSKANTNNVITGTFHFALGFSTIFQSITIQNNVEVDKGLWYLDASFILVGGDRIALNSLTNDNSGWLSNLDFRLGYKSNTKRSRDFGMLVRCSPGVENGGKWSISFTGSTDL